MLEGGTRAHLADGGGGQAIMDIFPEGVSFKKGFYKGVKKSNLSLRVKLKVEETYILFLRKSAHVTNIQCFLALLQCWVSGPF